MYHVVKTMELIRCEVIAQQISAFVLAYARVSYDAAHIFKLGCITKAYISVLNLAPTLGTHIRNNPSHCSQLLSELLVFELIFVNIGLTGGKPRTSHIRDMSW